MKKISANSIGHKVAEILNGGGGISVKGGTSRGVFLESEIGWMLFLSGEKFRGPLTLTLPDLPRTKERFIIGSVGKLSGEGMEFKDIGVRVKIQDAEVWAYHPAYQEESGLSVRKAIESLKRTENAVIDTLIGKRSASFTNNEVLHKVIIKIPSAIQTEDYQGAVEMLGKILGIGEGLTPEGDDFVIGLLFVLRIANSRYKQEHELLAKEIVDQAQKKTTRLSSNLIECAALGQVDERISLVVDSLITGQDGADLVEGLMNWGNTSGGMALAGIISGILACE